MPNIEPKPYKGVESYQVEDADFFFGRSKETEQLLARVLSSRLTLLHAQSGAGKTSLLNACVIPGLEVRGSTPVRTRLENHPTESVRVATLHQIVPPPNAEHIALERTLNALQCSPGTAIGKVLDQFDKLPSSDRLRRQLLEPIDVPLSTGPTALPHTGPLRPLFFRLLRSTLEISQYSEHLNIVRQFAAVEEATPVNDILEAIASAEYAKAYEALIADLYVPVPDLSVFFENLFEVYGARRPQFAVVLILDQFEELFTLFVDNPRKVPKDGAVERDWRLRWEFLEQLEKLYQTEVTSTVQGVDTRTPLSIRYVISMRDEYIAQLDPLRRFVADLDNCAYHLSFLEKSEAKRAIQEPAHLFGFDYSDECYEDVFGQLTREDRFVEPIQLQIVCEKLWNICGQQLVSQGRENGYRYIQLENFPEGKTKGILDSFFAEFLKDLGRVAKLEALGLLEPLVTSGGTRNIVERRVLTHVPFRSAEWREQLLGTLQSRGIVRIETRLGGEFVEITHEFLIDPILAAIRTVLSRDSEYSRFRWALRTLERFEEVDFKQPMADLLNEGVFSVLNDSHKDIEWNDWGAELMFRSSIHLGSDKETLRRWADLLSAKSVAPEPRDILNEARVQRRSPLLDFEERDIIRRARESLTLAEDQIEFMVESYISRGSDAERESLVHWTRELKQNGT